MKLSLTMAGTALLLIAATGLLMETKTPAAQKTTPSTPKLLTKKTRRHEIPAASSSNFETGPAPMAETVSAKRRNAPVAQAKQPVMEPQEITGPNESPTLRPSQPSAMPLAYQIDEVRLAEKAPAVPPSGLNSIKDDFEQDLGPDPLDPASPEYARRWQSAELMAAARLRARYGWAVYAGMQKNAVIGN